jgi:hypothetical protein
MKKISLLTAGAVLVFSGIGWAQDADSDLSYVIPPKPPYVARMPQKSAWTIEFVPNDSSGSSTPPPATGTGTPAPAPPKVQLKQQNWTKSNGLIRCVDEYSNGTTTEDWVVGPVKLSQDLKEKGIHLYSPKSDPRYHDFSVSDFEMLDWLTPKSYDHAVKHGGEVCYLFTSKSLTTAPPEFAQSDKSLAGLNAPTTLTSVFISVQSHLPLEIDDGTGKYIYHYLPTPTDDLKLPEAYVGLSKAFGTH